MRDDSNVHSGGNVVHRIRLHGPWEAETVESGIADSSADLPKRFRIKIPGDWSDFLGHNFTGTVRLERSFGKPTGLIADQLVWLSIDSVDFSAHIWLNEVKLGAHRLGKPPIRFPVHSLLQARNRLRVEIKMPPDAPRDARSALAGGILGDVRLEICEP